MTTPAHGTDRLAAIKVWSAETCGEGVYVDGAAVRADMRWLVSEVERLRDAVAEAGELFDEIADNNWSVRSGRLETIAAWLHWYHQTLGGE